MFVMNYVFLTVEKLLASLENNMDEKLEVKNGGRDTDKDQMGCV